MIQITKEMRKQLKREEERQDRIEKCLSYFRVNTEPAMTPSGYITYAAVNSTTTSGRRYLVYIDESGDIPVATRCNCNATVACIHMQAVNAYYARIASIFAHTEEEQPATVEEPVYVNLLATYDIQSAADEIRINAFLSGVYEELALTKTTAEQRRKEQADHCPHCGKLCKGDICGYCVQ